MLSVNSNTTTSTGITQPQNVVAFSGKTSKLRQVSKSTLDSYKYYKKSAARMSEHKLLWFFANIKSSISSWFRDLKIMLKKPKDFIEYNPFKEKADYSTAHSIKAGEEGARFAANITKISTPQYNNKETKALMEFHEALAKILLKK